MKLCGIGHIALFCKDMETSIEFYRDKLGCTNKFSISYEDAYKFNKQRKENGENIGEGWLRVLEANLGKTWISYFELGNGQFVELFDAQGATELNLRQGNELNYDHVAILVEDIQEAYQTLLERNVPIDTPPRQGMEHTWQMWSHDPDGNKVEFMQYTPESWQLVGR